MKACRDRFFNHLDPSLNHGQWTPEEDKLLLELHEKHANKWAVIRASFVGRSDDMLKRRCRVLKADERVRQGGSRKGRPPKKLSAPTATAATTQQGGNNNGSKKKRKDKKKDDDDYLGDNTRRLSGHRKSLRVKSDAPGFRDEGEEEEYEDENSNDRMDVDDDEDEVVAADEKSWSLSQSSSGRILSQSSSSNSNAKAVSEYEEDDEDDGEGDDGNNDDDGDDDDEYDDDDDMDEDSFSLSRNMSRGSTTFSNAPFSPALSTLPPRPVFEPALNDMDMFNFAGGTGGLSLTASPGILGVQPFLEPRYGRVAANIFSPHAPHLVEMTPVRLSDMKQDITSPSLLPFFCTPARMQGFQPQTESHFMTPLAVSKFPGGKPASVNKSTSKSSNSPNEIMSDGPLRTNFFDMVNKRMKTPSKRERSSSSDTSPPAPTSTLAGAITVTLFNGAKHSPADEALALLRKSDKHELFEAALRYLKRLKKVDSELDPIYSDLDAVANAAMDNTMPQSAIFSPIALGND